MSEASAREVRRKPTRASSSLLWLALPALLVGLTACSSSEDREPAAAESAVEVVTTQPPVTLPLAVPPPKPGTVRVEPGPFTDRLRFERLRFHPGARPEVVGAVLNRVDVSEVIVLVLQVDFYDRRGRRTGSATRVIEDAEAFHEEVLDFSVRARTALPGSVAGVLRVPQFANE